MILRFGLLYYGWVLTIALGLITIVAYGTTQYLFGLLVVPISHEFGWPRAQVSAANSISLAVSGILGVWIGGLVDRHGARALMAAGSALGATCLVGLSFARHLYQFYLLWGGGLGLTMALTLYPVTFVVIANWFHHRRGAAMALLTFIGGLSSPIYIPLSGVLISNLGWRHALTVLALTQILIALPIELMLIRRRPEDHGLIPDGLSPQGGPSPQGGLSPQGSLSPQGRDRSSRGGVATAAAIPVGPEQGSTVNEGLLSLAFWTQTVANALGQFATAALWTHLVAYLIGRGNAPVFAALITGFIGLASLPGRVFFNILSDRFTPKTLLALAYGTLAAGIAVLALAGSPALLLSFVVVYGIGYGATNPLRATMMAEYFGRRAYGAITAIQNLAGVIGAASGPILAGVMFDASHSYFTALGVMGAGYFGASIAVLGTPRPRFATCSPQQ